MSSVTRALSTVAPNVSDDSAAVMLTVLNASGNSTTAVVGSLAETLNVFETTARFTEAETVGDGVESVSVAADALASPENPALAVSVVKVSVGSATEKIASANVEGAEELTVTFGNAIFSAQPADTL